MKVPIHALPEPGPVGLVLGAPATEVLSCFWSSKGGGGGGGEGRCSYKMHSLTQDRTGRQTALGYDALNEGPAGSGGEIVWSKEVTGHWTEST